MENNELYHHGILGQQWGKKNGPPYPLDAKDHSASEQKAGWRKSLDSDKSEYRKAYKQAKNNEKAALKNYYKKSWYGLKADKKAKDALNKYIQSTNETRWITEDYNDKKIKNRLDSETKISKTRQKYIEYYKKKGMSDDEAAIAAYKRERTEKMLLATGAVAVTAATIYGIQYYKEYNFDRIVHSGTELSRVAATDTISVNDGFYAVFSKNKMDVNKYSGLYATQLKRNGSNDIYRKTINIEQDLKIPSLKSATKALATLNNDPDFHKRLISDIDDMRTNMILKGGILSPGYKALSTAKSKLEKGVVDSSVYKAYNIALADTSGRTRERFFNYMKDHGYGVLIDYNDKNYSGYGTKAPIIVMDSNKVKVKDITKIGNREITQRGALAVGDAYGKTLIRSFAPSIAVFAGTRAMKKKIDSKKDAQIVAKYRKKHPNSKLSYKEIIRNYHRNEIKNN